MELIGNRNLLGSSFVIGTQFPKVSTLECVERIQQWLRYKKESDLGMSKNGIFSTHSVTILHHVPLDKLQAALNDLIRLYKRSYPYSNKQDFINDVLGQTIADVKLLYKHFGSRLIWYNVPESPEHSYAYYYLDLELNECYDYLIEPEHDIDFYKHYYRSVLKLFKKFKFKEVTQDTNNVTLTIEPNQSHTTSKQHQAVRPQLNSAVLEDLLPLLHDFFDPSEHQVLRETLTTFETPKTKLLFKSNGNKLTDTFKQLKNADFITGWTKEQLNIFIQESFSYVYRNSVIDYKEKTIEKTLSGNAAPCKNPIIQIKDGSIHRITP